MAIYQAVEKRSGRTEIDAEKRKRTSCTLSIAGVKIARAVVFQQPVIPS
jgi:hypothetical protein